LVAAAAATDRRATVEAACLHLGLPESALAAAERDRLVIGDRGRLRFYHPLVASAVYRSATEAERRPAHRAVSMVLDGGASARERVWHESEAAEGPDEALACALEEAAVAATEQNAPELAARGYERAAHLTASKDERGRRLLRAGEQWQLLGKSETALA